MEKHLRPGHILRGVRVRLSDDPISSKLWDTENGPGYGDEINHVEPGFNSGWLRVQG